MNIDNRWDSIADDWLMKEDEIGGVRVQISVTPQHVQAHNVPEQNYYGLHIAPYPPHPISHPTQEEAYFELPDDLLPFVGAVASIDDNIGQPYIRQVQRTSFGDHAEYVNVAGLYSQFTTGVGASIVAAATLRTPKE